jgi:deoxyribodipyrimidine photo-lyase
MSYNLVWLRRDLRLNDNHALFQALLTPEPVQLLFIFDSEILAELPKNDARVEFIHQQLRKLNQTLQSFGSSIRVEHGKVDEVWERIRAEQALKAIFCNRDYEPYAKERDERIKSWAETNGISWYDFADQVAMEPHEVLKDNGSPYTVFTPYSRKWKERLEQKGGIPYFPSEENLAKLRATSYVFPSLESLGFQPSGIHFPSSEVPKSRILNYDKTRNFPSIEGTSRLSVHLRFGTVSPREKMAKALQVNTKFATELIWREFYMSILSHFPRVTNQSFKPEYDRIEWRNNPDEFEAWKKGKTGYPLVDAGMRELNRSGHMHNRVRMVVASFLTKHLLIDWRWGEAYFAEKLLDFELSSNNGGWQWAAGSGVDAAPYFRVFNPQLQLEKFDKQLAYVRRWVPEYGSPSYPKPIVEHSFARQRCLETYAKALKP